MIQNEREIRHELVLQAARRMMTAARTAPKGKGIDIIEIAMVTDGDILRLSDEMIRIAAETGFKFLLAVDLMELQNAVNRVTGEFEFFHSLLDGIVFRFAFLLRCFR